MAVTKSGSGFDFQTRDFRGVNASAAIGNGLNFQTRDFRGPNVERFFGNGLDFQTQDFRGQDPRSLSQVASTSTVISNPGFEDRRVRLRPMSRNANNVIFGDVTGNNARDNILAPLHPLSGKTNGLIFPYTPAVTYQYQADWAPQPLVHTNYEVQTYSRSYPTEITVNGLFTAQTEEEARYALAAIHFFRTVTKMYFGKTGASPIFDQFGAAGFSPAVTAGTPPPVLLFSAYGEGMFNDIPVVVKMFQHELLNDTDYVPVIFQKNKTAWIPVAFNIIITLGVQLNLRRTREEFNLDKFRTGELLGDKGDSVRGRGGWL